MRTKRTIQLSKDELLHLIEKFDNDKVAMADHVGIGTYSLRSQLMRHEIYTDRRATANKKRAVNVPAKDILIKHYYDENLTFVEIAKIYDVSNVTVSKWYRDYEIEVLSHSETITQKVLPKVIKFNQENYGTDHIFTLDHIKEKIKNTFIENYGVPYHPIGTTSKAEMDVLEFFNSLHPSFEKARMFGIEMDGYSKDLNIAFEYCGIFWHKETIKGKSLHEKKYKICKENGIRLFTIFEDEWVNKNAQVKGFIKAALRLYDEKVFARKLTLEVLPKRDLNVIKFLNDTHIQGAPSDVNTIKHYVLKRDDEIVSVMSLGKHHRSNRTELIINRCCTKPDLMIVGGSRRLFHAIKIDYPDTDIKTWSDNRWSEGEMYMNLGFDLHSEMPKDYSYVIQTGSSCARKSKQSMTKKNLKAKDGQTEYERALELGFDRIWDCGKKTWVYRHK